jgi:hypothetical protein
LEDDSDTTSAASVNFEARGESSTAPEESETEEGEVFQLGLPVLQSQVNFLNKRERKKRELGMDNFRRGLLSHAEAPVLKPSKQQKPVGVCVCVCERERERENITNKFIVVQALFTLIFLFSLTFVSIFRNAQVMQSPLLL